MLQGNAKVGGTAVGGSYRLADPKAMPVEGFPPVGEVLWEIGLILVALLGLALAVPILSAPGAG
jgi:hypothetical protein